MRCGAMRGTLAKPVCVRIYRREGPKLDMAANSLLWFAGKANALRFNNLDKGAPYRVVSAPVARQPER